DQAPDGIEAFECVLAQSYDLVVTDAKLERLDTPDLITKLRGHGVKTPILVLTAVTKGSTLAALKKLGIVDYVHKCLPPEVIRQKIAALLPAPPVPKSLPAEPSTRSTVAAGSVLMIDAAEIEHQRLRGLLPPTVTLDAAKTFNE